MLATVWQKIVCSFFTIMLVSFCYSQSGKPGDFVTVRLSVVGKGLAPGLSKNIDQQECFFALATVTNQQDTTVTFFAPSCAWPYVNWKTNSENVILNSPGCDGSEDDWFTLLPKQTAEFYIALSFIDKKASVDSVKLGFIHYSNERDPLNKGKLLKKVFWSNAAPLTNNLNTYLIRE